MGEINMQAACTHLTGAAAEMLEWKWDGRFSMALAEFEVEQAELVRALLLGVMGSVWDHQSVLTAPEPVPLIVASIGQLRPGQLAFASEPTAEAFMFAAWWPWGDGRRISVRVAPFDKRVSEDESERYAQEYRSWFGV